MSLRVKMKPSQIRKNGTAGYCIAIPGFWVENEGLRPKDQVDVFVNSEGELVIRNASKQVRGSGVTP